MATRVIVEARYENNVLKPLGNLDLKEGEEADIELKVKNIFEID